MLSLTGEWLVSGPLPQSLRIEVPSSSPDRVNLCNKFGIVRNCTTSYHTQSNGMVERFYCQLKASIMAHESPNLWTTMLPVVLLGIRSPVKETLGRSAAKMIYGTTLRLRGDFTQNDIVDAHTDLDNYSDRLWVAMFTYIFVTHRNCTFTNCS